MAFPSQSSALRTTGAFALSLSRLPLSRLTLSRLTLSRLTLSRLTLSRLTLSWLTLSRLSLSRLLLSRLTALFLLGDLAFEVFGQLGQFRAGALQRFDFVSEDRFGRLFDPLLQTLYPFARLFFGSLCFRQEAGLEQLGRCIQRLIRLRVARGADRVIELLGQQRLRLFGLLDDALRVIHDLPRLAALLFELLFQRLTILRLTQRMFGLVLRGVELLGKLPFPFGKLARRVAHRTHRVGEPSGRLLAEVFLKLLQLALGARAGVQRL